MGYRFDIFKGFSKVISVDIDKKAAKAFLSLVDSNEVRKGNIIKGRIEGDLFVTNDESNTIQVTSKKQAIDVLEKYYYSSQGSEIEDVLDFSGDAGWDANVDKNAIQGVKKDIADCSSNMYVKAIPTIYGILLDSSKNLLCDIYPIDRIDGRSGSGEVKFSCHFAKLEEVLKFIYRVYSSIGFNTLSNNVFVEMNSRKCTIPNCLELLGSEDEFVNSVFDCLGDEEPIKYAEGYIEDFRLSLEDVYYLELEYEVIHGYDEEEDDYYTEIEGSEVWEKYANGNGIIKGVRPGKSRLFDYKNVESALHFLVRKDLYCDMLLKEEKGVAVFEARFSNLWALIDYAYKVSIIMFRFSQNRNINIDLNAKGVHISEILEVGHYSRGINQYNDLKKGLGAKNIHCYDGIKVSGSVGQFVISTEDLFVARINIGISNEGFWTKLLNMYKGFMS